MQQHHGRTLGVPAFKPYQLMIQDNCTVAPETRKAGMQFIDQGNGAPILLLSNLQAMRWPGKAKVLGCHIVQKCKLKMMHAGEFFACAYIAHK